MTEFNNLMFIFFGNSYSPATGPIGEDKVIMIRISGYDLPIVGTGAGNKADNGHSVSGFSGVVN